MESQSVSDKIIFVTYTFNTGDKNRNQEAFSLVDQFSSDVTQ